MVFSTLMESMLLMICDIAKTVYNIKKNKPNLPSVLQTGRWWDGVVLSFTHPPSLGGAVFFPREDDRMAVSIALDRV